MLSPFTINTDQPLVSIVGQRAGYVQIASSQPCQTYAEFPDEVLLAAKEWARILESDFGSPRVYWITLSEAVRQLHIHLYPRWPEDTLMSLDLFNAREQYPQPEWSSDLQVALTQWSVTRDIHLIY